MRHFIFVGLTLIAASLGALGDDDVQPRQFNQYLPPALYQQQPPRPQYQSQPPRPQYQQQPPRPQYQQQPPKPQYQQQPPRPQYQQQPPKPQYQQQPPRPQYQQQPPKPQYQAQAPYPQAPSTHVQPTQPQPPRPQVLQPPQPQAPRPQVPVPQIPVPQPPSILPAAGPILVPQILVPQPPSILPAAGPILAPILPMPQAPAPSSNLPTFSYDASLVSQAPGLKGNVTVGFNLGPEPSTTLAPFVPIQDIMESHPEINEVPIDNNVDLGNESETGQWETPATEAELDNGISGEPTQSEYPTPEENQNDLSTEPSPMETLTANEDAPDVTASSMYPFNLFLSNVSKQVSKFAFGVAEIVSQEEELSPQVDFFTRFGQTCENAAKSFRAIP